MDLQDAHDDARHVEPRPVRGLLGELGDAVGEAGDFAARGVLMDDAVLGGAHQFRLRALEGSQSGIVIAAGDRLFDDAHSVAHRVRRVLLTAVRRAILRAAFSGGRCVSHSSFILHAQARRRFAF